MVFSFSGTDEARDRLVRFADLLLGDGAALGGCLGHAVAEVVAQQRQGDGLQRFRRGGDLREDIDAVLVLLDHPPNAADLSLGPSQALEEVVLAALVPVHPPMIPPEGMPSSIVCCRRCAARRVTVGS